MENRWREFLDSIADVGAKYTCICIDGKNEPLSLPFWTRAEIHKALSLQAEWGLNSRFIPFYGDWHDLLCLVSDTGHVVYLNDAREVTFQWSDTASFISSLNNLPAHPNAKQPGLVSSNLSQELQERVRAMLNQNST